MRGILLRNAHKRSIASLCGKIHARSEVVKFRSVPLRQTSTVIFGESDNVETFAEAKPYKSLPGPACYPIVGSIPAFYKEGGTTKFHVALRNFRKRYGDVYRFNLLGTNVVGIADPDLVEEVYRNEGRFPHREPALAAWDDYHAERNLSTGIFLMTGDKWWLHRSSLNPKMMKVKQVETYGPKINEVSDDFLKVVVAKRDKSGVISDMETLLPKWALEGAASTFFERRLGSFASSPDPRCEQFASAAQIAFNDLVMAANEITFLARIFGTKTRKSLYKQFDIMYSVGTELVHEKLKDFKERENAGLLDGDAAAEFIPYLYHVRKMDVKDIVSDIHSLLFAAVDTTSTTMLWALYYLGNHKDKQERLYNELQTVLGDETLVSTRDLNKLSYLKAVVKETLRCGAVVGFNSRIFEDEVVINGCKTPKGTMFILLHDVMSRDPKYFENPESFEPERWLRNETTKERTVKHPFVAMPFGFGPRMCLGRRLAELEIQILLSKIVLQYDVDCFQSNVEGATRGLVKPEIPLQFRLTKRDA